MKNKFHEEIIKPVQEKKTLMRANRLLSSKYALTAVIVLISAVSFFFFNYCLNTLIALFQNLENFSNPGSCFSVRNAFLFSFRECWGFYVVFLLLILAADIRIVYGARVSWKDYNIGQKGTERFAALEEIQHQYRAVPAKDQRYPGSGGFPVCRWKDTIYIDDGPVNNLIIGAPRSGKGESFVFPMIDLYSRAEESPSLVIIDPKLELYAASCQTLKKRGFTPLLLNTIDPSRSMGYNPLAPIVQAYKAGDYDHAQMQAKGLGYAWFEGSQSERDGDFWLDNSANATAAMILALNKNMVAIPLFEESNRLIPIKTATGLLPNPISSRLILQQLDMVLGRKAVLSKGQKCARKVIHLYDELGNIPPIPKLGARLTGGPGMNLLYTLVIHDFAQLKALYGESANTIITGCGNKAFLMTANMDTAREFSAMVGNETITNISRIGQKLSLDKSLTESYEEHPLINPNQLMHLHRGENIIHRVLKREDLQGNPVESYPIFNHGKTRFLYRYEYLLDSFPADISLDELPVNDLSKIDLSKRSFDVNRYFEKKLEQQKDQLPVAKLKNSVKLIDFLCCVIPGLTRSKASKFSVGQLRTIIKEQFDAGTLLEKDRNKLMELIEAGEANDNQ